MRLRDEVSLEGSSAGRSEGGTAPQGVQASPMYRSAYLDEERRRTRMLLK